jgi:rare lipoprotein A
LPPLTVRRQALAVAPVPAHAAAPRQDPPASASVASRPAVANGAYLVQAATMSTLDRAQKVAGAIGGSVSRAGQYFRVRTGPFATRAQAEASLAKVRSAGYSDARISTNG